MVLRNDESRRRTDDKRHFAMVPFVHNVEPSWATNGSFFSRLGVSVVSHEGSLLEWPRSSRPTHVNRLQPFTRYWSGLQVNCGSGLTRIARCRDRAAHVVQRDLRWLAAARPAPPPSVLPVVFTSFRGERHGAQVRADLHRGGAICTEGGAGERDAKPKPVKRSRRKPSICNDLRLVKKNIPERIQTSNLRLRTPRGAALYPDGQTNGTPYPCLVYVDNSKALNLTPPSRFSRI